MKKHFCVHLILLALCFASGCLVIVGGKTSHTHTSVPTEEAAPDRIISEIDAVCKLDFEGHKKQRFVKMAGREDLSCAGQEYLAVQSLKHLDFEPSKVDVLLALIANPSFCDETGTVIVRHIDALDFEPSKMKVLNALDKKQP